VAALEQRKSDHIRINLEEEVQFRRLRTGLEGVRLVHQALPELDLDAVDLSTTLLGKKLSAPILISSMTGGTADGARINRNLASAAQTAGIAMALGSQRAALEDPSLAASFQVRPVAPDILLLANLGAIQLNYGYDASHCQRAVDMVGADALILHLNPLQEAVQPEGDRNWTGLLSKIERVCRALDVPVIVKEVGWGLSGRVARDLASAGAAMLDVAGAGGTSWTEVEYHRAGDPLQARVATAFADWGLTTLEALLQVHQAVPAMPIIASGGLRSGIDLAKVIALGGALGGVAGPFLRAANESMDAAAAIAEELVRVLRIAMFCCGASNLAALREVPVMLPATRTCGPAPDKSASPSD
jgi:isopentenyl-diphosphate delta-isomerase